MDLSVKRVLMLTAAFLSAAIVLSCSQTVYAEAAEDFYTPISLSGYTHDCILEDGNGASATNADNSGGYAFYSREGMTGSLPASRLLQTKSGRYYLLNDYADRKEFGGFQYKRRLIQ